MKREKKMVLRVERKTGRKVRDEKSEGRRRSWIRDIRREDWSRIRWREIQWVRQVRNRGCILGIGFWRDRLIQFLGDERDRRGLAREVSARESVWLLGNIAGQEMRDLPDIESNSVGWWRWLRLLRSQLVSGFEF